MFQRNTNKKTAPDNLHKRTTVNVAFRLTRTFFWVQRYCNLGKTQNKFCFFRKNAVLSMAYVSIFRASSHFMGYLYLFFVVSFSYMHTIYFVIGQRWHMANDCPSERERFYSRLFSSFPAPVPLYFERVVLNL